MKNIISLSTLPCKLSHVSMAFFIFSAFLFSFSYGQFSQTFIDERTQDKLEQIKCNQGFNKDDKGHTYYNRYGHAKNITGIPAQKIAERGCQIEIVSTKKIIQLNKNKIIGIHGVYEGSNTGYSKLNVKEGFKKRLNIFFRLDLLIIFFILSISIYYFKGVKKNKSKNRIIFRLSLFTISVITSLILYFVLSLIFLLLRMLA